MPDFVNNYLEFDWDQANSEKNWLKHKVGSKECEEAFLDENAFVTPDTKHSTTEIRYQLLAKNFSSRFLSIVFTYRKDKIRIISARDMSRKEINQYEKI